jgi:hypothetical protein
MACIDPVFFENEFHLEIKEFGHGEHIPGNTEDAFYRTKVQASANELFPLCNAFRIIHEHVPFTSGKSVGSLERVTGLEGYPVFCQIQSGKFACRSLFKRSCSIVVQLHAGYVYPNINLNISR